MIKNICVFCSSSDQIEKIYFDTAIELAYTIAKNRQTLIFGGSNVGLMRQLAENVKLKRGKIIGIIPRKIKELKSACENVDELIVTPDMHTRKAKLIEMGDAFIAMPGGFGTLDELSEIIALKQLKYHLKPIVILNIRGFYDYLISFFENLYNDKFADVKNKSLYFVAENVSEIFNYLNKYKYIDRRVQ